MLDQETVALACSQDANFNNNNLKKVAESSPERCRIGSRESAVCKTRGEGLALRLHLKLPNTALATWTPLLFLGKGCPVCPPSQGLHPCPQSIPGRQRRQCAHQLIKYSTVQPGTTRINVWTIGVQNQRQREATGRRH